MTASTPANDQAPRALVFVDTETTGLYHRARPWEIAVIRREPDGNERTVVAHISDVDLTHAEPGALDVGGYAERIGIMPTDPRVPDHHYLFATERHVANWLALMAFGRDPILIGVGAAFDAAILSAMFVRHGLPEQPWNYNILDLKAATWGAHPDHRSLPYRSEQLAAAIGVQPPTADERHTALGDARWAQRWFYTLTVTR